MIRPLKQILKRFYHSHSRYIQISDKVQSALKNGEPVVALESTIITHGMPFPANLNTAKKVEDIIRQKVSFSTLYIFCSFMILFLGCNTSYYCRV